jgi:hypothetical protein
MYCVIDTSSLQKTTLQFSKMCFGESCVDDRSTKEGAVALARDGESYFGRAES